MPQLGSQSAVGRRELVQVLFVRERQQRHRDEQVPLPLLARPVRYQLLQKQPRDTGQTHARVFDLDLGAGQNEGQRPEYEQRQLLVRQQVRFGRVLPRLEADEVQLEQPLRDGHQDGGLFWGSPKLAERAKRSLDGLAALDGNGDVEILGDHKRRGGGGLQEVRYLGPDDQDARHLQNRPRRPNGLNQTVAKRHGSSIASASAQTSFATQRKLPLTVTPTLTPAIEAVAEGLLFALNLDISVYDAGYASVAGRFGVPLITADDRLAEKLKARL